MNNHTIVGVICQDPFIKTTDDWAYLKLRVQDKTRYNTAENPNNNYHCLKYGDPDSLKKLHDTLEIGSCVYISGEGLYNKRGFYNIIAHHVEILDKVTVEPIKNEYRSYYEQNFEENNEQDGNQENAADEKQENDK